MSGSSSKKIRNKVAKVARKQKLQIEDAILEKFFTQVCLASFSTRFKMAWKILFPEKL
jgi:hypothetical protein